MDIRGKVRVSKGSREGLICDKCKTTLPPEQGLYIVMDGDKRHEVCYVCLQKMDVKKSKNGRLPGVE